MKKLTFILILLVAVSSIGAVNAEKYAVTKSDGSISVVHYIPNSQKSIGDVLTDLGYEGYPVYKIADGDFIAKREDRPFWKVQGGKIVVDQVKKQQHLDELALIEAKKDAVLAKLKISKEDWKDITNKKASDAVTVS